jgi:ABC-2 type transport system permease protein
MALRLGLRRGWTEHLNTLADRKELANSLIGSVGVFVMLILWVGRDTVEGTSVSIGTFQTTGFLAFNVFSAGLMALPMTIAADREEGALLRARTLPRGMAVYLVGRATFLLLLILLQSALMLLVAVPLTGIAAPATAGRWLTLTWVLVLGTLAVVPIGAALGSLLPGAKAAAASLALPMMGMLIISGVMLPLDFLPDAVRWIAQAFPLYWMALGIRASFLPDSMLAAEIDHSWRLGEAAAVLGAWAFAGMVLAPWLLRRIHRG